MERGQQSREGRQPANFLSTDVNTVVSVWMRQANSGAARVTFHACYLSSEHTIHTQCPLTRTSHILFHFVRFINRHLFACPDYSTHKETFLTTEKGALVFG